MQCCHRVLNAFSQQGCHTRPAEACPAHGQFQWRLEYLKLKAASRTLLTASISSSAAGHLVPRRLAERASALACWGTDEGSCANQASSAGCSWLLGAAGPCCPGAPGCSSTQRQRSSTAPTRLPASSSWWTSSRSNPESRGGWKWAGQQSSWQRAQ